MMSSELVPNELDPLITSYQQIPRVQPKTKRNNGLNCCNTGTNATKTKCVFITLLVLITGIILGLYSWHIYNNPHKHTNSNKFHNLYSTTSKISSINNPNKNIKKHVSHKSNKHSNKHNNIQFKNLEMSETELKTMLDVLEASECQTQLSQFVSGIDDIVSANNDYEILGSIQIKKLLGVDALFSGVDERYLITFVNYLKTTIVVSYFMDSNTASTEGYEYYSLHIRDQSSKTRTLEFLLNTDTCKISDVTEMNDCLLSCQTCTSSLDSDTCDSTTCTATLIATNGCSSVCSDSNDFCEYVSQFTDSSSTCCCYKLSCNEVTLEDSPDTDSEDDEIKSAKFAEANPNKKDTQKSSSYFFSI